MTSDSTVPGPSPRISPVFTMPQPCGWAASSSAEAATVIGPTTLDEMRPAAPKNATPAAAYTLPEVTVTPERSTTT